MSRWLFAEKWEKKSSNAKQITVELFDIIEFHSPAISPNRSVSIFTSQCKYCVLAPLYHVNCIERWCAYLILFADRESCFIMQSRVFVEYHHQSNVEKVLKFPFNQPNSASLSMLERTFICVRYSSCFGTPHDDFWKNRNDVDGDRTENTHHSNT